LDGHEPARQHGTDDQEDEPDDEGSDGLVGRRVQHEGEAAQEQDDHDDQPQEAVGGPGGSLDDLVHGTSFWYHRDIISLSPVAAATATARVGAAGAVGRVPG